MVALDHNPDGHGLPRRAFEGARKVVIPGLGLGTLFGLVVGAPVILCGGAGAILAMVVGATVALIPGPAQPHP